MKTLGKVLVGIVVLIAVVLVGGWLALRRPAIPFEALEAKYASPASRYMELPSGERVHYRDEGRRDGPALVLVHGFSASLHTWEPWVRRLGDDYRIISLDLPGHGLTRTPEGYVLAPDGFVKVIDQVTRRLGAERFVLAGNSMGGGAAWAYALTHPERMEGLVLVDSAGWPPQPGEPNEDPPMMKILAHPLGRAILRDLDSTATIRQGLRAAFEPTPDMADEAMVRRYVEMGRAPGHKDILYGLFGGYADRDIATRDKLARIGVPTLIMHGDTDKLIPVGHARLFGEAIPGATVIIYEKTGHIPMEQVADRSAADLDAWLKTKVWAVTAP